MGKRRAIVNEDGSFQLQKEEIVEGGGMVHLGVDGNLVRLEVEDLANKESATTYMDWQLALRLVADIQKRANSIRDWERRKRAFIPKPVRPTDRAASFVLSKLIEGPKPSQWLRDVWAGPGNHPGTLTRAMGALLGSGLMESDRSPGGIHHYRLTEKGRAATEEDGGGGE